MAVRSRFPEYVEAATSPIGRGLARTGVTPNALTTTGLVLTGVAAWFVANGRPVAGGAILLVGGLMDTFDGAVARAAGRATPFGGFLDSVVDRISDGVILAALAWWVADQPRVFALAVTALVAAEVTSYVRAKAEAIDLACSVGILERAERAVLLIAALLFHPWLLEPVLWILAAGGVITVVQRVHHVWCQIDRDLPDEIIALTQHDRAWSRAFTRAARRFYGERNFDVALEDESAPSAAPPSPTTVPTAASVSPPSTPAGPARASGTGPRDADRVVEAVEERDADGDRDDAGEVARRAAAPLATPDDVTVGPDRRP